MSTTYRDTKFTIHANISGKYQFTIHNDDTVWVWFDEIRTTGEGNTGFYRDGSMVCATKIPPHIVRAETLRAQRAAPADHDAPVIA